MAPSIELGRSTDSKPGFIIVENLLKRQPNTLRLRKRIIRLEKRLKEIEKMLCPAKVSQKGA